MSEKPRKFTNGYYPSNESRCDDKSNFENSSSDHSLIFEKHSEENVVGRTNRLEKTWNKVKNQEKHKNLNFKLIKSLKQDVEQEVGYLEDWMEENDEKIEEVKIYKVARWSSRKKTKKLSQYKDVLTDIEVHGKLLKLLLSFYKAIAEDHLINDDDQAMRSSKYLETVWHGVWLRAMEWECLIEQSLARRLEEGDDCVDHKEEDILITLLEKREITVKRRSETEINLNNTRCPTNTCCHLSKSSLSEISKSSQICDSDCLSSDSGFSDLSYDFPTCLVRNIPPMSQTQTNKIMRQSSTNLQKETKKHIWIIKKTNIGSCKLILFLIVVVFTLILILLLISNIKCNNNTCAIYINTHLQYYRGPPPF